MINTDTTVCGVRGTDFMVSVDPQSGTTVAVQQGRVAVIPSSKVVFDLLEASASSDAAAQAIQAIVESASIVEPDQELTVSRSMADSASAAYVEIAALVAAAPVAPSTPESASRAMARIAPPPMIMFDSGIDYGTAVSTAVAQAAEAPAAAVAEAGSAPAPSAATVMAAPAQTAVEAMRPELAETVKRLRAASVQLKPVLPAPVRVTPATKDRMKALDSMQAPVEPSPEPVSMVPSASAAVATPATTAPAEAPAAAKPAPAKPAPAKPAPTKPAPAKPAPAQAAPATAPLASAKPSPVLGSWKAVKGPVTGSVVRVGPSGVFVLSDPDGNLTGMSEDGKVLWQLATANRSADRSYPVPFKGLVYYSGSNELVAIDSATGAVIARETLEGDRAHIFGTRVVPFPGSVVSPTRDTLEVLDERTGKVVRSIPVPDGITMTPANYDGFAAIVNQKGVFMLLDLVSGQVKAQVQTGAVQPVALAPRIHGTLACFADRKGLLVMVDLASMTVAWERSLPGASGVYTDIEIGDDGVFAFSKDMVY
ncbi:MAG TPA: PQQ-binding-like beta-propeller repeat protein, partial [Spirochaetales bacterium]|nr:PQQ-binding-like beta-propeller repeat protein [Spirochaetales bacterium]